MVCACLFAALLVAVLGWNIDYSMNHLRVKTYRLESEKLSASVRIVFFSDLHCRSFGENNQELYDLIFQQNPDFIVLAGDLFSRDSNAEEISALCAFLSQLASRVPVFYSLGNHEAQYIQTNGSAVLDELTAAGMTVLEEQFQDIEVQGQILRIGGMEKLAYQHIEPTEGDATYTFLQSFCETEKLKLLLNHRPEGFYFGDAAETWDVDVILSGHTHGGLIRLPGIGGLYAPIQGFFPDVSYGEYPLHNATMLITSGLAGYGWIPRVNNPPEIVTLELVPKEMNAN